MRSHFALVELSLPLAASSLKLTLSKNVKDPVQPVANFRCHMGESSKSEKANSQNTSQAYAKVFLSHILFCNYSQMFIYFAGPSFFLKTRTPLHSCIVATLSRMHVVGRCTRSGGCVSSPPAMVMQVRS